MSHLHGRIRFDDRGNITALDLSDLNLAALPPEIGQLVHLESLKLSGNRLTSLPAAMGGLTNLQELDLSGNRFPALPPEVGRLINLQYLSLSRNRLATITPQIAGLANLEVLDLSENQLTTLPPEIGRLQSLKSLYLWDNDLVELPAEIGALASLQDLYLSQNQLQALPAGISRLANLEELYLAGNNLSSLPLEIVRLTDLQSLTLENNPALRTPPPEIVARGQHETFDYLRDLAQGGVTRHEAKLLMVGEGGTGKSSLLRALRGESFVEGLATTHGIDIRPWSLPHPSQSEAIIILNVWDFGGQQIYHTTHQFFMTQRSLYLLVWNARGDADQARLDHWLRKIQVLAPRAPVILVATHVDERRADLNYRRYKETYPQLAGHLGVSNKDGTGMSALRERIAQEAAQLPLMEQQWPRTWVAAECRLRDHPAPHLSLAAYVATCREQGVAEEIAQTAFGGYLHDLGKILYYQNDNALSDFVVLKPNWLTRAISLVLDHDRTRKNGGVLDHADFSRIWTEDETGKPYERRLYPLFLRLMERYLISFKLENKALDRQPAHSLVPLLLPHDPPPGTAPWREILPDQPEINMLFRLPHFIPPGLMSWFIVLTHRYTQGLHWREGVRLAYQEHQAEAILNPSQRELWLRVRGPAPSNFFNILQHTITDRILDYYFEGLEYKREVPCNCHLERGADAKRPCSFFHDYARLAERIKLGKLTAECGVSFKEVSVPLLLEGIHHTTDEEVAARLEKTQRALNRLAAGQGRIIKITSENHALLTQNAQMFEQLNRSFARLWNLHMAKLNAECPNSFLLLPGDRGRFNPQNLLSNEFTLHLLCQNPTGPHIAGTEPGYPVPQAKEWWTDLAPWLSRLVDVLKYVPKARALADALDETFIQALTTSLEIFESALQSQLRAAEDVERLGIARGTFEPFAAEGPALRALHSFLKKIDPQERWSGLHRVATNDGNIFWLCNEHRPIYE